MQASLWNQIETELSEGTKRSRALRIAGGALLLGVCGFAPSASAQAQVQPLHPLEHEFAGEEPLSNDAQWERAEPTEDDGARALASPTLRLEVGRSPSRAAFALDISGGLPDGWALLELRSHGSSAIQGRQLVRLDGNGDARVLRLDHRAAEPIEIVCSVPRAAAQTATLPAHLPAAAEMIEQSRALVGANAPNSPFAATVGGATGLVITEIMKDPAAVSDSAGEWFEVRNLGATTIDVSGWSIRDAGSNSHTIPATAGTTIPPRSYFVFGINANPALNGGVNVGYKYSSFTLGNGADDIQLYDAAGLLVDAVAYDDGVLWPDGVGKSMNLQRALVDTALNDDGANWCDALNPIGATSTDFGTPRLANNACP